MECIDPNEIKEGDLLAYIDGASSRKVKAHIKKCNYCAEQVADLRKTMSSVLRSMYRSSCPSVDTLIDYQNGSLTGKERRGVQIHVQKCPHCTLELKELESFFNEQPSVSWQEQFQRPLRKFIEAIRIQSPSYVAGLQGVRGGESTPVLFQAGGFDIFLGSQPDSSKWSIKGRATRGGHGALELVGHEVWLEQSGSSHFKAIVDEKGWFMFDQLSPGSYDVRLVGDEVDIVIKEVVVGS